MTDPQMEVTGYDYDELNRLETLTSHQGVFSIVYDDASRRDTMTFPNDVVLDYLFDDANQLRELHYKDPAQTLLSQFDYTYDDAGNRETRTTLDGVTTYSYNEDLDRLEGATGPDPSNPMQTLIESYMYDAVGNRTASHLATGQMHDDANRLLEDSQFAFGYDANGNVISKQDKSTLELTTYDWDVENRLIAVRTPTQTVTFRYDALGRRTEKTGSTTTRYIYDLEDIVEERDGNNVLMFRYVHGPGIDEPLARRSVVAGQTVFFHIDALGSIADVASAGPTVEVSSAYRYDSYGNPLLGANSSGFAFAGREWDAETGLYFYRARYYEPTQGRFVSEDPIGLLGGSHYYLYVRGNPLLWVDPLGLVEGSPQNLARRAAIARIAESYIGSHAWAKSVRKEDFPVGVYKCNKFVCDVVMEAGAVIEIEVQGIDRCPRAGEIADPSIDLDNWRVLNPGETPLPGDIAAYSIPGGGSAFSGHTGVFTPLGIVAGRIQIVGLSGPGQFGASTVYRRYTGD
jgi:RHS repeat-associated protein